MKNTPTFKHLKLGIVTPLANEEAIIEELISRTLPYLSDQDRIFYVLDNKSKDLTRDLIEKVAKQDPRIVLVFAPENRSVVDAYFRGYKEALKAGCDWILEMDGGLSHSPEEIPRFIEAMSKGIDFAAGSRFCKNGKYINLGKRYFLSKGGTILSNLVLSTKMKDMTSGFECFSRQAMQFIVDKGVESRGHFFQTEIRYHMRNWKWVEIPITYKNPSKSVGSASIIEALKNLWKLRKT